MAEFKSIEATPENIAKLQQIVNEMDAMAQSAQKQIEAMTEAIKLMLLQPDSGTRQNHINVLCQAINVAAFDAMNCINCEAEEAGANHIDEENRALFYRIHEAARSSNPAH